MLSLKRFTPVVLSLLLLTIVVPSFAQDSLEVNLLSKMFENFDSIGGLQGDGEGRFYIIVNRDEIHSATGHRPDQMAGYYRFPIADTVHSIYWEDDILYIANDDLGMATADANGIYLSDPLANFTDCGKCFDVVVASRTAFITTDTGCHAINVSLPSSPTLSSQVLHEGGFSKVVVNGIYAYVTDWNNDLYVINISNTNNIQLGINIDLNFSIENLYIYNNTLYLLSPDNGLTIYSLHDPANPSLIAQPENPASAYQMTVQNDTAWVSCGTRGFGLFDISAPENIQELASYHVDARYSVLWDGYAYVNTSNDYYTILNVTDTDSIYQTSVYGNSHIIDYVYYNRMGFVCDDNRGLRGIDVSYPWYIGDYLSFDAELCHRFAFEDTVGAFLTTDNKVVMFDPGRMWDAGIQAEIELGAKGSDLVIENQVMTVSIDEGGFNVYDLNVPFNPALTHSIATEIDANGIDVEDETLFLVNDIGDLYLYDISSPTAMPNQISVLNVANYCFDILVFQGFAFVACGEEGVKVVDVYEPESPSVVTTIDTDGIASDITIGGRYFYIADGLNGVRVYDIHDPYYPEMVGYYDTPGNALRVDAWHENCGVADEDQFLILRYAYATETPEDDTILPSEFKIESVYPNPFNPDCQIKINIPKSGLMNLKVFNVLGKEVSTLSDTRVKAGFFEYQFFGKNLASGTYILQVELEGYGVQSAKMVLMK